ncbi:hypothetical protein ACRRTK_000830 [Alexandromys fortis]
MKPTFSSSGKMVFGQWAMDICNCLRDMLTHCGKMVRKKTEQRRLDLGFLF